MRVTVILVPAVNRFSSRIPALWTDPIGRKLENVRYVLAYETEATTEGVDLEFEFWDQLLQTELKKDMDKRGVSFVSYHPNEDPREDGPRSGNP